MRDAKFRALTDIQTGPNEFQEGFVYGGIYIHDEICKYITTKDFDFISAKKDSIGQYTGLKDKNGVEIYEGDILHHQIQGNRKVIYPMSDNFAGFGLESTEGKKNTLQDSSYLYEVVGNIHQNPELLEK